MTEKFVKMIVYDSAVKIGFGRELQVNTHLKSDRILVLADVSNTISLLNKSICRDLCILYWIYHQKFI